MRVRRCKVLYLEPREETAFDLQDLLAGGNGVERTIHWMALAPHLGIEIDVDRAECELLATLSAEEWIDKRDLSAQHGTALKHLLQVGLVIGKDGKRHAAHRQRDDALRDTHWHPLAATLHSFTRWDDIDAVQSMKESGMETIIELREKLGRPPAEVTETPVAYPLSLPRTAANDFDQLLSRRATCRNFDAQKKLPLTLFAQLMQRVFSAQASVRVTADTAFLKKTSPSGGGLHPIDAYLVVQHVDGIAPGLYHYHAVDHALQPLPSPTLPLRDFILQAVARQEWFADAHALVLLAPRFDRTFWKYRNHAKAYRVIALEAGHLSQTLYLSATEAGFGAFITGAINEVQLEQAFGLDHTHQGVLAICGFGWRSEHMTTVELDPASEVWQLDHQA